jgi:hypothetical protein
MEFIGCFGDRHLVNGSGVWVLGYSILDVGSWICGIA